MDGQIQMRHLFSTLHLFDQKHFNRLAARYQFETQLIKQSLLERGVI
jgi:hypothetical protein